MTISLGGATGAVGFTSDSQAETFADTVWNLFLGGSSSTRPFGSAILDGYVAIIQAYYLSFMIAIGSTLISREEVLLPTLHS